MSRPATQRYDTALGTLEVRHVRRLRRQDGRNVADGWSPVYVWEGRTVAPDAEAVRDTITLLQTALGHAGEQVVPTPKRVDVHPVPPLERLDAVLSACRDLLQTPMGVEGVTIVNLIAETADAARLLLTPDDPS